MTVTDEIARIALDEGWQIGVAESLTGGHLATAFAAAPDSSQWFAGGIVAYESEVKFRLLGVTRGPVVSERCAEEMAVGVRHVLGVDVAIAVTGAGGPGPQDGQPPGTVHLAVSSPIGRHSEERRFSGEPAEIIEQAVRDALHILRAALERCRERKGG